MGVGGLVYLALGWSSVRKEADAQDQILVDQGVLAK
jgi:hypothetical protein